MRDRQKAPLRRGWTTGACATAAARAAYTALVSGDFPDPVTITLPRGRAPAFALARHEFVDGGARAAVVKDAGDDPDVTHGALVVATVRRGEAGQGVRFAAGEGVGTVTRDGLPVPAGEPAINPAPRRMIAEAVAEVARSFGEAGDVTVEIAIPGGERLAERTMNRRLGVVGGLSVLGTTGVVTPYSCSAWVHSIHQGIDVARAAGLTHVAAATGSTSEAAVRRLYGLPEHALIDMGDFAGAVLKYLRNHPIARLTLAGGFAKLSKLAAGRLDLHSGRSQVDLDMLRRMAAGLGASHEARAAMARADSATRIWNAAQRAGIALGDAVAAAARDAAGPVAGPAVAIEVILFDRGGAVIGRAHGW